MSVVVSDTSPIRALSHLELLPLLGELYDEVIIPTAVFNELTREGKLFPPLSHADLALFQIREPSLKITPTTAFLELDAGEREAIRLAIELSADGLLIDENCGRRVATAYGLRGQAKRRGLIDNVGPLIDRLRTEINFFISPVLQQEVLADLGEWPPIE